jgi:hypothetical protein
MSPQKLKPFSEEEDERISQAREKDRFLGTKEQQQLAGSQASRKLLQAESPGSLKPPKDTLNQ